MCSISSSLSPWMQDLCAQTIVCDTIECFMLFLTFILTFSRHTYISIEHIFNRKYIYLYYFILFFNFFTCVYLEACVHESLFCFLLVCVYIQVYVCIGTHMNIKKHHEVLFLRGSAPFYLRKSLISLRF